MAQGIAAGTVSKGEVRRLCRVGRCGQTRRVTPDSAAPTAQVRDPGSIRRSRSNPNFSGIESSIEVVPQITPLGVHRADGRDLPVPFPALHLLFARNRQRYGIMPLKPDEVMKAVAFGEPVDHGGFMFKHAPREVARDAGIERAVALVGHDVDPACHLPS